MPLSLLIKQKTKEVSRRGLQCLGRNRRAPRVSPGNRHCGHCSKSKPDSPEGLLSEESPELREQAGLVKGSGLQAP